MMRVSVDTPNHEYYMQTALAEAYQATEENDVSVGALFSLLDDPRLNHRCQIVSGVLADQCGAVLTQFFQHQRSLGKK